MEIRISETREIEQIERRDGSTASRVPLSRRHYRFCLFLGVVLLPCFGSAPFLVESFSVVFTAAWSIGAALFFIMWFWAVLSHLKDPNRFDLEVDAVGVRERLLLKEQFWKWADIESIELFYVDTARVVGFRLKQRTWKRRWRLAKFDAILLNQYAVSHVDILTHLKKWQQIAR